VGQVIGGITMIDGIRRLEDDLSTKVIIIVSKPPAPETLERILHVLKECKKPIFVNFLGSNKEAFNKYGIQYAVTLEELAVKAVNSLSDDKLTSKIFPAGIEKEPIPKLALKEHNKLWEKQNYIRGLYTGGTLAIEACLLMLQSIDNVFSNVSLKECLPLENPHVSQKHTVVDLGADEFTVGKPHPMLEPEMRHDRILQEAADPDTAVILLDFVLGYGVHSDPVGAILPVLSKVKRIAEKENRYISLVASVCGTDQDPQNRSEQIRKLKEVGAVVMPTNAQAVKLAKAIVLCSKAAFQDGKK
jgi:FdrA protein